MSYTSGFMMGTAIAQGIGQLLGGTSAQGMGRGMRSGMGGGCSRGTDAFQLPDMRFPRMKSVPTAKTLELAAALPGRRRYRVAGMTKGQAEMLEESLKNLSCMKEVRANAVTGSLILIYDAWAEERIDELTTALEKRVFGRGVRTGDFPPAESHAGAITRSIRNTMRAFSIWLKELTNGWFDASSLASLLFFFQGFRKMLANQQMPSGSQMFWWAVSLMRGWRAV